MLALFAAPALAQPLHPAAEERARLQAHFADVLRELRAVDLAHLDAETRARRAAGIAALEAYAAAGVFPRNPGVPHPQEVFIDAEGRPCAMAELLVASGAAAEAEAISARENLARIEDMESPALDPWLAANGFTREEAQRIQPAYCFGSCPLVADPVCVLLEPDVDPALRTLPPRLYYSECVAECALGGLGGAWEIVDDASCGPQQVPTEGFNCLECETTTDSRCGAGGGPGTALWLLAVVLLLTLRRRTASA